MIPRLAAGLARSRPDAITSAAIVLAFMAAALLSGYVIASGKPVPILLTFGAFAGIALLGALPLVVWSILVGTLLISGPVVMFVPALDKIGWLFAVLGIFLTGASILAVAMGRGRFARPSPGFVGLAVVFFVFGIVSLLYSGGPLMEGIRAGKRYFQYFGLLFILATVPFSQTLVRRWWAFLVGLAFIQLPFAVYQRIALVPLLEGKPGVFPLDIVVGTMEGSLEGGGSSSVMAILLIFTLAFFLSAYREGVLSLRRFVVLSVLAGAAIPLGETTVIVILLPLAVGAVYLDLVVRSPFRFLLGVSLGLAVLAVAVAAFLAINAAPGQSLKGTTSAVINYNFGQGGYYGGNSLNRTTLYPYWLKHQSLADPVSVLFGHGLGSSFGGVNEPDPGHMDFAHSGKYIGLTAASSILWDLGILGFGIVLAMFGSAMRHAARLVSEASPGFDRAFCRALLAMSAMLFVMLFHSKALITVTSQEVLWAMTFGLIAWRWRRGAVSVGHAD